MPSGAAMVPSQPQPIQTNQMAPGYYQYPTGQYGYYDPRMIPQVYTTFLNYIQYKIKVLNIYHLNSPYVSLSLWQ